MASGGANLARVGIRRASALTDVLLKEGICNTCVTIIPTFVKLGCTAGCLLTQC